MSESESVASAIASVSESVEGHCPSGRARRAHPGGNRRRSDSSSGTWGGPTCIWGRREEGLLQSPRPICKVFGLLQTPEGSPSNQWRPSVIRPSESVRGNSVQAQRLIVFSLISVCFVLFLWMTELMGRKMGATPSSPVNLTLVHRKDVKKVAHNNSVNVKKNKRVSFCTSEWPTIDVGWPRGKTFNLTITSKVEDLIFQPRTGHPGQVPYTVTWRSLVERADGPLPWVRSFLPSSPVPVSNLSTPLQVLPVKTKRTEATCFPRRNG